MTLPAKTTVPQGAKVPVGSPVHSAITQFLYEEAFALDHRDFEAWTAMLAEDLIYTAPLRTTRTGPTRDDDIVYGMGHFDDTYDSIMGRLGRLATKSAWAEDPPSRTRRLVTNVLVRETDNPDEFAVVSAFLMTRNRYENATSSQMSGERRDLIRRDAAGDFKIARRQIIFDQSVLGMSNLAVFF